MIVDTVKNCCDFAVAAIDGVFGWMTETVALLGIVLIFNFLVNKLLKHLHYRFEKQKRVWQDSLVRALYKPLTYYIWFFALVHLLELIAIRVIPEATIENMHIVLSVGAVVAAAWFLQRWKRNILQYMITKSKNREIAWDISKLDVIDKLATVLIIFLMVLLVLEITNRSVNTLIAFGGIGGLAIAFASQEIIANFFAGLMIYATHPFAKGDWIIVPDRDIEGVVEEIGWYMTRIKSMDKRPLYVPNSVFSKAVLINPSRMSHRQFKETIGLRYTDMNKLKSIIADIKGMLASHPQIDHNHSIAVQFSSYGSYSLNILVSAYTPTIQSDEFASIKADILFKIGDIVLKHGADMAFPSSAVYFPDPLTLAEKR